MNKVEEIENYLDELIPNPVCELTFHNDYELLIAVVLSAQSTDKRVNTVTPILFSNYPNLKALKKADINDLENLVRPIGSFHKKAFYVREIARLLDEKYDGVLPQDRTVLETFPGVGRKTVNVVLNELYDIPAIAVDTHVERISKRLGLAFQSDDVVKVEHKLMKKYKREVWGRRHKQMVLFGRYYCKAVKPECEPCKLQHLCKYYKKTK